MDCGAELIIDIELHCVMQQEVFNLSFVLFQHRDPVAEPATFGVPGSKRRFEVFGSLIRGGELLPGQAQALLDSRSSHDHALLALGELSNAGLKGAAAAIETAGDNKSMPGPCEGKSDRLLILSLPVAVLRRIAERTHTACAVCLFRLEYGTRWTPPRACDSCSAGKESGCFRAIYSVARTPIVKVRPKS